MSTGCPVASGSCWLNLSKSILAVFSTIYAIAAWYSHKSGIILITEWNEDYKKVGIDNGLWSEAQT